MSSTLKGLLFFSVWALLLLLTLQPAMSDPYYHRVKVNFWEWLNREINEIIYGEKE